MTAKGFDLIYQGQPIPPMTHVSIPKWAECDAMMEMMMFSVDVQVETGEMAA
jgi:hypothetical protein